MQYATIHHALTINQRARADVVVGASEHDAAQHKRHRSKRDVQDMHQGRYLRQNAGKDTLLIGPRVERLQQDLLDQVRVCNNDQHWQKDSQLSKHRTQCCRYITADALEHRISVSGGTHERSGIVVVAPQPQQKTPINPPDDVVTGTTISAASSMITPTTPDAAGPAPAPPPCERDRLQSDTQPVPPAVLLPVQSATSLSPTPQAPLPAATATATPQMAAPSNRTAITPSINSPRRKRPHSTGATPQATQSGGRPQKISTTSPITRRPAEQEENSFYFHLKSEPNRKKHKLKFDPTSRGARITRVDKTLSAINPRLTPGLIVYRINTTGSHQHPISTADAAAFFTSGGAISVHTIKPN